MLRRCPHGGCLRASMPKRRLMSSHSLPPHTVNPKGSNVSLWMGRNAASADVYPPLRYSGEKFDVVVIGAGITGLTSALHLKRAGMRVAVLEQHTVGSGATGSTTGHISLHLDTDYSTIERNFSLEAAMMAYRGQIEARDEIVQNCVEFKIPGCEGPLDAFLYAEPGQKRLQVHEEYDVLLRMGNNGVSLLSDRFNIGLPFISEIALKIPGSAYFDAHRYCQALARTINSDGSSVFENTRVIGVTDGEPCEVQVANALLRAPDVILATHTPLGISALHTEMVPSMSFALALHVEKPLHAALYYDTAEPYHYIRRLDTENANIVIVGGADKQTGDSSRDEVQCFDKLRHYATRKFQVRKELAHWSAQFYPSADGLPYVGTDPGKAHTWIATGFSGDGLTLGTLAGKILAQSILGERHPLAATYSAHRFKPIASARQFLSEGLSVARHIVGDRLTNLGVTLKDVRAGEGRIVQVGSHKVAAYRDDDGKLFAHSAVCPHLKCIVKWNSSEKTFDCPCHGSRFSAKGKVLEGPALSDLEDVMSAEVSAANRAQSSVTV